MAERLDFQCEHILLSKYIFIHPQDSINKELLFPKQLPVTRRAADGTKNHICTLSEWHREYALLLALLEKCCSTSTEIILSSGPVVHPASTLIFWFRGVYQARVWMQRKYIACELDGLLHTLLNIKRLIAFFHPWKCKISYFTTYHSTFNHARYHFWCPVTPFPLGILARLRAGFLFMKQRS